MNLRVQSEPWRKRAACRGLDPGFFFPDRGGDVRSPKRLCAICPVREPCAEYAVVNHERFGIWGGTSDRERTRIRKQRKLREAEVAAA